MNRERGGAAATTLAAVTVLAVVTLGGWGIRLATASSEGRVGAYEQKESANNRIFAQSYFEQTSQDIEATQAKINRAAAVTQPTEQDKTILAGLQNYCASVVADYNAKSRSYTTEQFKAADLPAAYDPTTDCEPTR